MGCAACVRVTHVACLSFVFVLGRLAMPRLRHGSKARHVLLLPQARRAGVEAAEEGQYGDNGRRGAADQIEGACACTRRSLYGGAGGERDAGSRQGRDGEHRCDLSGTGVRRRQFSRRGAAAQADRVPETLRQKFNRLREVLLPRLHDALWRRYHGRQRRAMPRTALRTVGGSFWAGA